MVTKPYALYLLLFALLLSTCSIAQQVSTPKKGMWPENVVYTNNQPVFKPGIVEMPDANGRQVELKQLKNIAADNDQIGFTHHRYQQTFNGIPIEHAVLVQHVKNRKLQSQNGKWIKDFPAGLSASPAIPVASAVEKAMQHTAAKKYRWESPEQEAWLKQMKKNPAATYYPTATLVYYAGEKDIDPAALKLAYRIDVFMLDPFGRKLVFVDAVNGNILGTREMTHHTDAPGVAQTGYSGTQNITADFTGTNYRLRSANRGGGIATLNAKNSFNMPVDFTDADNNWNNVNAAKDEYATDAHWASEKTYDYYFSKFNRNSYDNNGTIIYSVVHVPYGVNASWEFGTMNFGDGDATNNFQPMTAMDVVGHEFTHGVTEYSSGLVYDGESGAMNEAFSDIFGTAVEFENKPNADWKIAAECLNTPLRDMSNPNAMQHPDTYQGQYWHYGSGGLHINSGVLNHWFYLLTQGGSGVNDHGTSFSVNGIGINKAAAIAYRLNVFYLNPISAYPDARVFGIMAAEDLYGAGSNEAVQTANAFTAVGLYGNPCVAPASLSFSNITATSATANWSASANAVNYLVEYRLGTSGTWTLAGTTNSTSINLTGLIVGSLYQCRISSNCGTVNSGYIINSFSTACAAPTGLSSAAANTSAAVNWTAAPGAVSYTLYYWPVNNNMTSLSVSGITGTTYSITGLTSGTTYAWTVRTVCDAGNGNTAANQTFTTTGVAPCNTPTGLSANAGINAAIVKWTAATGVTNYTVEYKAASSATWITPSGNPVIGTSFSISGLQSSILYDWRVRSNCSSQASNFESGQFTTLSVCAAPSSLASTINGPTSVTISWGAVSTAAGYSYEYKAATSSVWNVFGATSPVPGTSANITGGLQPGTTYDWRVRSSCGGSFGNYAASQFTTPAACVVPTGLNATAVMGNSAILNWTAASGATSYSVDYRPSSQSSWTHYNTTSTNSISLTGLTEFTTYFWRVKTICSNGLGNYASSSFITIARCDLPTGLAATAITQNSTTLNWNSSYGAGDYTIEYKQASATAWIMLPATSFRTLNLTGLQPATLYDWRVRSNCYNTNSAYATSQFVTASLCGNTANLASSAVTSSSANISWDAVPGTTDYTVEYKEATATMWVSNGNTSLTNAAITALQANTVYQWRVKANCGSASGSFVQAQFTTAPLPCAVPSNLTAASLGSNSATLSWNGVPGVVSYTVEYRPVGAAVWTIISGINSSSIVLSPLNPATVYEWQVSTNCGVNQSGFVQAQFTTLQAVCNIPANLLANSITENAATLNWNAVNGAAGYTVQYKEAAASVWQNTAVNGTSAAINNLQAASLYDWRVSTDCGNNNSSAFATGQFTTAIPACDAPAGLTASNISHDAAILSWNAVTNAQEYKVQYRTSALSGWQTVITPLLQINLTNLAPATLYEWQVSTTCTFGNASGFTTSQFSTLQAPPVICNEPAGLSAGNITTTSALISWQAVASAQEYQLAYKKASETIWQTIISTNLQEPLTGLLPGTLYDCRVRTKCGISNVSGYTSTIQFTTVQQVCNAPASLNTNNISTSSATVSWAAAANANGYTVEYKQNAATVWQTAAVTGTTASLAGLTAGSLYDWRVRTDCGNSNFSGFATAQFNTLPVVTVCNAPMGLQTTYNGASITATWAAVAGASSYRLEYKTAQASTWTVITGINTTSRTISGLATGNGYQLRVQSVCNGSNSAYSNIVLQPLPCLFAGNNSQEFIDYFKVGTIDRTSGAEPGGYINTGLTTNLTIGSSNAARISAGFTGGNFAQGYAVYIDLNRNGSFADAGERVFGVALTSSGNIRNFNFTVPATATPGLTNMRVVMVRNTTPATSCLNGVNGEAEDYRVNLTGGASLTAANGQNSIAAPDATEKITVMPNPSTGLFIIKLPDGFSVAQYELLTTTGKTIFNKSENRNNAFSIDISNQPSGIYLLKLVDSKRNIIVTKLSKM